MTFERITTDPEVLGGVPCIRGLRIPVATVVGMVADGMRFLVDASRPPQSWSRCCARQVTMRSTSVRCFA